MKNFVVHTNGTNERLRITSGGVVNIGAASPTTSDNGQFNCYTTTSSGKAQFVHAAGTGGLRLAGTGAGSGANLVFSNNYNSGTFSDHWTLTHSGGDDSFRFIEGGTGGTERLRITSGGSVNIGDNFGQTTYKTQIEATDQNVLRLVTDSDNADGVELVLRKDSASPADNDNIGNIFFQGNDDGGNATFFASMEAYSDDVSNGSENGYIRFRTEMMVRWQKDFASHQMVL